MVGICQSIDRCELQAVVVALRWATAVGRGITLWTDSKYVFDGLQELLNGIMPQVQAHPDLWLEAAMLLEASHDVFVQLAPSHVDPTQCDDPVAEWATSWNSKADLQAGFMNNTRAADFQARHAQLLQTRRRQRLRIGQLADRFVQIAERTHAASFSNGFDDEEEAYRILSASGTKALQSFSQ